MSRGRRPQSRPAPHAPRAELKLEPWQRDLLNAALNGPPSERERMERELTQRRHARMEATATALAAAALYGESVGVYAPDRATAERIYERAKRIVRTYTTALDVDPRVARQARELIDAAPRVPLDSRK